MGRDDLSQVTAACPRCGATAGHKRPKFTWWGGLLGPKLLKHAVCGGCGAGFNAETGKSNTGAIVVYSLVAFVIVFALFMALASMK